MNTYCRRRTVLLTGSALLAGPMLGGCLDGNGTERPDNGGVSGPGENDTASEFGITDVELLSAEPEGYRNYQPAEDGQYTSGATVWLYVEPVGVTTARGDGGQQRVELTTEYAVFDGDGAELATERIEFQETVTDDEVEELYLYAQFSPPEYSEFQEYIVEITVTDELSGASTNERVSVRVDRAGFGIEHVRFVNGLPTGYREYTLIEDPVYVPDDTVYVYFEPKGLGVETTEDGERLIGADLRVTVTEPDGEDYRPVRETIQQPIPEERTVNDLFLSVSFQIRLPGSSGEYTVDIELMDQIDGGRTTASTTFRIEDDEDDGNDHVGVFREAIEEETTIEIQHLSVSDDGSLMLAYRSNHAFEGDDEFDGEVAYIAGVFAGTVDSGLDVDSLRATGQDRHEDEFTFKIATETALSYMNDEITSEEYLERVYDSLRRRR